jgi:ParB-like chromosome segregation protein Spo0J
MRVKKNKNRLSRIAIENLVPHPGHPNRMSKRKFAKLIRNIERMGRYEPLVVRPCPAINCRSCGGRNPDTDRKALNDCYQIINGYHRWKALNQLGYETVDVVVWDIDDSDTDILLATLNRLGGSDVLEQKLALIGRLNRHIPSTDLEKLLPYTARQIHRLAHLHSARIPQTKPARPTYANPVVFFLTDAQLEIVEKALSNVREPQGEKTRAAKKAVALTHIAQQFNMNS